MVECLKHEFETSERETERAKKPRERVVQSAEFFAETGIVPMRYPNLLSDRLKREGKL